MKLGRRSKRIKLYGSPSIRPKAWNHIKIPSSQGKGKRSQNMAIYKKSYVNGIFTITKSVILEENSDPIDVVVFTCDTSTYGQNVWLHACSHGIGQKFGDSYAGKNVDDETVRAKCTEIHETLSSGNWNKSTISPKITKAMLKEKISHLSAEEQEVLRGIMKKANITI
jgi:hypothetical protein